jgi:hypothetical protein
MVANTGTGEVDHGVKTAGAGEVALVDQLTRGIPTDDRASRRRTLRAHEAHDLVAAFDQCRSEGRTNEA